MPPRVQSAWSGSKQQNLTVSGARRLKGRNFLWKAKIVNSEPTKKMFHLERIQSQRLTLQYLQTIFVFYPAWMCHISNLWKSKEMDSKYKSLSAAAGMCCKSMVVTWTWVMAMYPLENCSLAGSWPGSEAVLDMSRVEFEFSSTELIQTLIFIFNEINYSTGKNPHFGKLHYKNLCLAHVNFGEWINAGPQLF